jgi:type IV secretion system protein VirD4
MNNYFVVKLLSGTFLPLLFFSWVLWHYRHEIYERRPYKREESLHGDARWASESDIKGAGLRSKNGMLLGVDKKGYLIASGYQHALLFAPTGSGKGVGFVIPNLLFYDESVICNDIKLEKL